MRTIKTASGAVYTLTDEGKVHRQEGRTSISNTNYGNQYTDGFINEMCGEPEVGNSFVWMGVMNDYTEPIWSSEIVSIEETDTL